MEIDPTRWLVSLAGFVVDWLLSREWKRILLALIPVLLLATVVGFVWWGRNLDKGQLAEWYMQLGNEEIAAWEQAWAPPAESEETVADVDADRQESAAVEPALGQAEMDENPSQLSRYAEILFRRVQLLAPTDRSQFVIGATLAQRGAIDQAKSLLTRIAPNTGGDGYAPAHALLTQLYLAEWSRQPSPDLWQLLRHHVSEALRWERVPQSILEVGFKFAQQERDAAKSVSLLAQAAERNPQENFRLAEYCHAYNVSRKGQGLEPERKLLRIFEQAWDKSEKLYKEQLAADSTDVTARTRLASLYVMADQAERGFGAQIAASEQPEAEGLIEQAERILREGEALENSPEMARALSELYRFRFLNSVTSTSPGQFTADLQLLDTALRIDPSNPRIDETIARLVRLGGPTTPEQIEKLEASIAQGKATAATHRLIAEKYLIDVDYDKALPHLEQVVQRLGNDANSLNNLAFVLSTDHPNRLDEMLDYSTRAVGLAAAAKRPNADYYDTLGGVLSKLNRGKEAITAYETAIELEPQRIDFHQRVAAEYARLGADSMAAMHAQEIERLRSQQSSEPSRPTSEAEPKALDPSQIDTVSNESVPIDTPPSDTPPTPASPTEAQPGNQSADRP